MSDLKYQTPAQLKSLIKWCENKRNDNRAEWERLEAEVAAMIDTAKDLRRLDANIGQKECWARVYLARGE